MSDALDYLLKVRPDAMRSYFEFLKKSTGHLDTKTRAIISLITKVDNQTEAGFRQYLNRALQAGVTANEIIDALFMAFPTLGLSKIVWAIDIIISMNIPEFKPEKLMKKMEWQEIIDINEVKENKITVVNSNNLIFFIFKKNEKLLVFDNRCPHQSTMIPENGVNDTVLTCPKHGWKFDLESGECIERGNKNLTNYETKIENNRLYIRQHI